MNRLIEVKVNAIFSKDLTNPAKQNDAFEQIDHIIKNLQLMIEKQKSDVSVYTKSLLQLKQKVDQCYQNLGEDPSENQLIDYFSYLFKFNSVYGEFLEDVIMPYDASFYLTTLLQSKLEEQKNPELKKAFSDLMAKRRDDQLAEPKLFQLKKWQFNSKMLPKIEKAYLYLCEITGIPPIAGTDPSFWLSNR